MLLLGGACVSPGVTVTPGPPPGDPSPTLARTSYRLGERQSAVVGAEMLFVEDRPATGLPRGAVRADRAFEFRNLVGVAEGVPGVDYPVIGYARHGGVEYAVVRLPTSLYQILVDSTGRPLRQLLNGDVFVMNSATVTPADVRFVAAGQGAATPREAARRVELWYGGNDGAALSVTLREYRAERGEMPALTQELRYPARSDTLRFRDLRIAVHAATADRIEYTVVADGH